MHQARFWRVVGVGAGVLTCLSANAYAAGPYAVDDAAIGNPGECHVESWVSVASNGDFIATTQPACVAKLGGPIEFTTALHAVRIDGEWAGLAGRR